MLVTRRIIAGVLFGAMVSAVPARADVIAQSPQGFVSRNVVVVAATPAAVWKRLITPAVWWSSDHTFSGDAANMSLDPVPGGCFCERLPGDPVKGPKPGMVTRGPSRGGVEHMRVVFTERGKALRMVGALGPLQSEAVNATLTVTLTAMDSGTRIVFEYVVGGYMRYPADKIQPAVDTVMSNQLLSLAHGFAPGAASQSSGAPEAAPAQAAAPQDAPARKGLDKHGLLLPRGRIWSLPPSDGVPSAPAGAASLQAAPVPNDVTPSGGAKARVRRGKAMAPKPAPVVVDDAPMIDVPAPAVAPEPPAPAPVAAKKRGKPAHKVPAKPVTPPKSDEPTTDSVNSAFDSALGDPQRPVTPTPN